MDIDKGRKREEEDDNEGNDKYRPDVNRNLAPIGRLPVRVTAEGPVFQEGTGADTRYLYDTGAEAPDYIENGQPVFKRGIPPFYYYANNTPAPGPPQGGKRFKRRKSNRRKSNRRKSNRRKSNRRKSNRRKSKY